MGPPHARGETPPFCRSFVFPSGVSTSRECENRVIKISRRQMWRRLIFHWLGLSREHIAQSEELVFRPALFQIGQVAIQRLGGVLAGI